MESYKTSLPGGAAERNWWETEIYILLTSWPVPLLQSSNCVVFNSVARSTVGDEIAGTRSESSS